MAATLLFHGSGILHSCHMSLGEEGRADAWPPYPELGEDPPVRIGPGAIMVATRCPGGGEVDLEIWAGDPGSQPTWTQVFDGELETVANGFDVGDFADSYHLDAPPGRYRVRAQVRLDQRSEAEAVRFVFPQNPNLSGRPIAT